MLLGRLESSSLFGRNNRSVMDPNKQQHQLESQTVSLNAEVSTELLCVSEMHITYNCWWRQWFIAFTRKY